MTTTRVVGLGVLAGSVALMTAGLLAAPAWAEETTCTGPLGAVTVDNLRVPPNATCTLTSTLVKGSVTVASGASLLAIGAHVVGNVQAENAASVIVGGWSRVGGNVQVKQGGAASVTGSTVTGDIQFDQNRGGLAANDNRVGGNIQIFGNSGGADVNRNTINGNLQCKENTPGPTGAGNVVGGDIEDQCRQMAPTPTTPPTAATPQPPQPAAPRAVSVTVKPVNRGGKLFVNVNPNKGHGYWAFRVQHLKKDGTWGTHKTTYRTSGSTETRTLNFKKGTYRVQVHAKYGYTGATSTPVTLHR